MVYEDAYTHLCMTGIHHDAVERDPLLCEGQCELEVLRISCVIQVDSDWHRGLVSPAIEPSATICIPPRCSIRIQAELQPRALSKSKSDREELYDSWTTASLRRTDEPNDTVCVVAVDAIVSQDDPHVVCQTKRTTSVPGHHNLLALLFAKSRECGYLRAPCSSSPLFRYRVGHYVSRIDDLLRYDGGKKPSLKFMSPDGCPRLALEHLTLGA